MKFNLLIYLLFSSFATPVFAGLQDFSLLIKDSPAMQGYKTPDGVRYSELLPKETVVNGIYLLQHPKTKQIIFYSSEDLAFIEDKDGWREVIGNSISKPLPKERQLLLDRELIISRLNLDDAIVYKFGNGHKKFLVLTAIDCGHCKDLEEALKKNAGRYNATLYLFPSTLSSESGLATSVRNIWCSTNPSNIWQSAMTDPNFVNKIIDTSKCSTRKNVATSSEIGLIFRTHGTPAFISAGGINGFSVLSGFPPRSKSNSQDQFLDSLLTFKE